MLRNGRLNNRLGLAISAGVLLVGAACGGSNDAASSQPEAAAPTERPPVATATSTPPSAADAEATVTYVQQVETLMDDLAQAATAVAEIMAESDVDSAEWRSEATSALDMFGALHERAEGLEADRDVEHVQDRLLAATDSYSHAASLIGDSIESLDLDGLEEANIALGEALVAAAEVRLLLDELAS